MYMWRRWKNPCGCFKFPENHANRNKSTITYVQSFSSRKSGSKTGAYVLKAKCLVVRTSPISVIIIHIFEHVIFNIWFTRCSCFLVSFHSLHNIHAANGSGMHAYMKMFASTLITVNRLFMNYSFRTSEFFCNYATNWIQCQHFDVTSLSLSHSLFRQ